MLDSAAGAAASAAGEAALPPPALWLVLEVPVAGAAPPLDAAPVPSTTGWAAPLDRNCTPLSVRLSRLGRLVVRVRPAGIAWQHDRGLPTGPGALMCCMHWCSLVRFCVPSLECTTGVLLGFRAKCGTLGLPLGSCSGSPEAALRTSASGAVVLSGWPSLYQSHLGGGHCAVGGV